MGSNIRSLADYRVRAMSAAAQPAAPISPHSGPPKPRLLDRVRQAIRTRHYSHRTEKAYVHWIKRFIFFHNKRHPVEMGEAEIARFLSSLATESRVSASTQNQALNALVKLPLLRHLQAVRRQHEEDLRKGLGRVALPNALDRKYPILRHPSPRRRLRHPDGPGAPGTQGCQHDDDLHPRVESGRERNPEPGGFPAGVGGEPRGRYIGIILVGVCRLDGVQDIVDKSSERKENRRKHGTLNDRHILISILNR